MKVFITCAVIALLLAIVVVAAWPDASGQGNAPLQPVKGAQTMSSVQSDRSTNLRTKKASLHTGLETEAAQPTGISEPLSPAPEIAVPDSIHLYDALLALNFSEKGNLVMDRNTRSALQVMYGQLGVPADAQRVEALRALLIEALPEESAQQLLGLLQSYAEYRQAEHELRSAQRAAGNDHPLANYDQIKNLRRSYLGDEVASGLFSEEEAQLPYMVEAMAVARDASLPAEERAQKLAALQAGFNEAASRMDSPLAEKVLAARVARLRAEGASDAEIFAARNAVVGSAEAQRLAEADQARPGGEPTP